MDNGTYSAASGGVLQLRKLDVVSNNLANVNTVGFKKQAVVSESQGFDETFAKLVEGQDPYARGDQARTPGVVHAKTVTDFSQGAIKNTDNPLDVALRNPKDFFVVNTPDGPQYTRAGSFSLDSEGNVVTSEGFTVSGDGGGITAAGPGVSISGNGTVTSNKEEVGRLQVVRIDKTEQLEHVAGTRFKLVTGAAQPEAVEGELVPQSLEMSNVSVITGMLDMIAANRAFEMYTKSAQTIDGMNQTSINQVGRQR